MDQFVSIAAGPDPAQITGRQANQLRSGLSIAMFDATTIRVNLNPLGVDAGANVCSYSAATGGIVGVTNGLEAPAWVDFPVT